MPSEDLKIVDRLLEKDQDAWNTVVREYQPFFESMARRVVDSDDDAAECVQRTLASLWEDDAKILRSFRGLSTLKTYLTRIVHRDCLDFIRSENRQKRKVERKTDAHILKSVIDEENELVGKVDIESLIAKLTPKNRLLVKLIYYDGLTHEEVARVFSSTAATVDVWHFRLKRKLRGLAGIGEGRDGIVKKEGDVR